MSNDKGLLSGSITILIGAVIAIMALVRGPWQAWLLIGVFTLWGLWVVLILLLPYMQQAKRRRQRQQRERQLHAEGIAQNTFTVPELEGPVPDDLLLRYANHRILTYLRSSFPNACFEWCEKRPADLIRSNGTGRIRLYNVEAFDHADITFGKDATIRCDLLKIVPLSKAGTEQEDQADMETLIADLNSRGHSKLTLKENGDICILQGEELVPQEHLSNFPAKVYWPRLVEVFESNGLAAETTAQGIQVSW